MRSADARYRQSRPGCRRPWCGRMLPAAGRVSGKPEPRPTVMPVRRGIASWRPRNDDGPCEQAWNARVAWFAACCGLVRSATEVRGARPGRKTPREARGRRPIMLRPGLVLLALCAYAPGYGHSAKSDTCVPERRVTPIRSMPLQRFHSSSSACASNCNNSSIFMLLLESDSDTIGAYGQQRPVPAHVTGADSAGGTGCWSPACGERTTRSAG